MGFMGTVNKQFVREEVDRTKSEFDQLSATKKLDIEYKMLFQSMLMLINLIISVLLERTTSKNSKNSSKPSSQTQKDETALTKPGTHTKGKDETDDKVNNTRTVETVTISKVSECQVCDEDLSKIKCSHYERRTKIDIVFEKVVEHIDTEIKECPNCYSITKGEFRADMPGPLQYGNGLKAYIINLLINQMISLHRVQKMVTTIIGEVIAQASLLKFVLRLHEALAKWESNAFQTLLISPAMHVDETSQRVDKKNQWLHKAYCRISSYLQTMSNKGVNPLIAIQMALAGKIS